MDFAGKVALVTGGSRGIGRGIALALARHGAHVAIVSRGRESAEAAVETLVAEGATARAYACDVAVFDDVQAICKEVVADFERIDFLVNNAGVVNDKLILRMGPADWEQVIATNLTGVFNFSKVVSPHFIKQRSGRIVNISSVVGLTGNAGQASYAASKAGIIGFTKSLAKELASRRITVNAVAPGYIETDMTADLGDSARERMLEMIPLGRLGTVDDVAKVVLFLLSDLADYVTGQVVNCDGGMVMQ